MNINATIIGQSIAFLVFVWFCMKYVWPPIMQALADRQKKIAEGLEAASRAVRDLELAQKKATEDLREAKKQAQSIIEQGNKRASQIIDESKDIARTEGERLIVAAHAAIDQEVNRARETLRKEVAGLALAATEKMVDSRMNPGLNDKLVTQFGNEL